MKPYLITLLLGTAILSTPALAQSRGGDDEVQAGELTIAGAFIRATLPRAPVGGAYVTITNAGEVDDRLVSVTAPIGDNVVVHEMVHDNGIMSMRTLPNGMEILAGETVSLTPSESHMMINGLDEQLKEGQSVDMTMSFEVAGDVAVSFDVLALNARSHPDMDNSELHSEGLTDHGGHSTYGMHEFDQKSVTSDKARISGLLKNMFETPEAPLSVAPILIDGDLAITGWAQGDAGGRALLRRNENGFWTISLCAGGRLKGADNMMSFGIDHDAAMRLSKAQSTAEAELQDEHAAKFALFDGVLFIDPDAEHGDRSHDEHRH